MDKIIEKNIENYNAAVKKYYKLTKELKPRQIALRNKFISKLPSKGSVLDIRCGPGRDDRYFSDKSLRVTGIDLATNCIKFAKNWRQK